MDWGDARAAGIPAAEWIGRCAGGRHSRRRMARTTSEVWTRDLFRDACGAMRGYLLR
jgi:hypothetical protein